MWQCCFGAPSSASTTFATRLGRRTSPVCAVPITDMTWDDSILEQFEHESEYCGPYNTLLTTLFPCTEHYQVAPQYRGPATPGSMYFTIYIVRRRLCPVFFIEVKPISTREKADNQMRDISIAGRNIVIPKLYGISAVGTRFTIHDYDKKTQAFNPAAIPCHPQSLTDVAPADRWAYELLEPAGEARMKELVEEIKAMCAEIVD